MATIQDVKLDVPVTFFASRVLGIRSSIIESAITYSMEPHQTKAFISELKDQALLPLIEDTLQSLAQRKDGTLLKHAFPTLDEVKQAFTRLSSIPDDLRNLLNQWEDAGANEVLIEFEQKTK